MDGEKREKTKRSTKQTMAYCGVSKLKLANINTFCFVGICAIVFFAVLTRLSQQQQQQCPHFSCFFPCFSLHPIISFHLRCKVAAGEKSSLKLPFTQEIMLHNVWGEIVILFPLFPRQSANCVCLITSQAKRPWRVTSQIG